MKRKQPSGNGSGKFDIRTVDMGGWVRIFPPQPDELPEDLAVFLSHTLSEWFRQRPHLRMRCAMPVSRDGSTIELHAWYDAHLFPPSPEAPQPETRPEG